jgi:hypothetical protein
VRDAAVAPSQCQQHSTHPSTAAELLAFTAFTAAGELQKLQKHALELPQDLQEAVQFYVLGSSSQVGYTVHPLATAQRAHSQHTAHVSHCSLSRVADKFHTACRLYPKCMMQHM